MFYKDTLAVTSHGLLADGVVYNETRSVALLLYVYIQLCVNHETRATHAVANEEEPLLTGRGRAAGRS